MTPCGPASRLPSGRGSRKARRTPPLAEHEADGGWAMDRVGRPSYGDDGVSLDGAAYGWDTNRLHIWREANVLLAAGALGVTATDAEALERWEAIARAMDARAADR